MTLNLSNGDFVPHIRWMAQTASWQKSTEDGREDIELKHAVFDLANIQTGWGIFAEGQAPEWIFDPTLAKKAPRPPDGREWKRGFKLNVYSKSALDGVREFATTATGACMGILALYEQYEAQREAYGFSNVPVVQFDGATRKRVGKGNTAIPNFQIIKWIDRPAELPLEAEADHGAAKLPYTDHQAPLDPAIDPELDDPIEL